MSASKEAVSEEMLEGPAGNSLGCSGGKTMGGHFPVVVNRSRTFLGKNFQDKFCYD